MLSLPTGHRLSGTNVLEGIIEGKGIEEIVKSMNDSATSTESKGNAYEAVVLNTNAGSPESTQYDKYNIPNSVTLYRDSDTNVQEAKKYKGQQTAKAQKGSSKFKYNKQKKYSRIG